jgi:probable phosphoglycerate mutase
VTTTVFYVRHVPHELQDKVQVGRREGVRLRADAPERLQRLTERFAREPLAAVYASPILRAQETAKAVGAAHPGLEVRTCDGLNELDAGDWTGLGFEAMQQDPAYEVWNSVRSLGRIPGGESMLEVQSRMIAVLEEIRDAHPDQSVAIVSHGDPIKAALLYLLGLSLDAYQRIEVEPGSVSTVAVGDWGAKLIRLNEAVYP